MKLYRGINIDLDERDAAFYTENPDRMLTEIETHENGVGIHWVERKQMAEYFAIMHSDRPGFAESCGVVLEAEVDEKDIIEVGTEEWAKYSEDHQIMDPDNPPSHWRLIERESTVRPGSNISITGYTIYTRDPEFDYDGQPEHMREEEPEPVEKRVELDELYSAHICEPVVGPGQDLQGYGW